MSLLRTEEDTVSKNGKTGTKKFEGSGTGDVGPGGPLKVGREYDLINTEGLSRLERRPVKFMKKTEGSVEVGQIGFEKGST